MPASTCDFSKEECPAAPSIPVTPVQLFAPFDLYNAANFGEMIGQSARCNRNSLPNLAGNTK